jgi:hypothetical protein
MKKPSRKRQISSISNSRWAAYAAAGAASALAGAHSAEAEIHYSGVVNQAFRGTQNVSFGSFPLDQSVKMEFVHIGSGKEAGGGFVDIMGSNVRGYSGWGFVGENFYVSNLAKGVELQGLPFYAHCDYSSTGTACYDDSIGFGSEPNGHFKSAGVGYLGFRFDRGDGYQYGWARIRTNGAPRYDFVLLDYAWADPGEGIQTGQRRSTAKPTAVPTSGSLGLIALGAVGLLAWRKRQPAPQT